MVHQVKKIYVWKQNKTELRAIVGVMGVVLLTRADQPELLCPRLGTPGSDPWVTLTASLEFQTLI